MAEDIENTGRGSSQPERLSRMEMGGYQTHKPLSAEMAWLVRHEKNVITEQGRFICPNVALNTACAIMLDEVVREWREDGHPREQFRLPLHLEKPLGVIKGVKLTKWDKESRRYMPVTDEDKQLVVPRVLVKQGVGNALGIVIAGPYAGLVLEPERERFFDALDPAEIGSMCLGRLISDDTITNQTGLYSVSSSAFPFEGMEVEAIEAVMKFMSDEVNGLLVQRFRRYVGEGKKSAIELLLEMSRRAEIEINVNEMNWTQSLR